MSGECHYLCKLGMVKLCGKKVGQIMPVFRWYEKDRRRDKDNVAMAKKFILDSLQEMDIIRNDGWKEIIGFVDEFFIDKENPRIEVLLYEPQDEEALSEEILNWMRSNLSTKKGE